MRFQSLPFIHSPSSHVSIFLSYSSISFMPHNFEFPTCSCHPMRTMSDDTISTISQLLTSFLKRDICAMGTVDVHVPVAPDVAWRCGRTTTSTRPTTSRHGRRTWTPWTWRRLRCCRRCRCRGVGSSAPKLAVAPASCRSGRKKPRNRKKDKTSQPPTKRQTQKALEIERFLWKASEVVLFSHKASENRVVILCCVVLMTQKSISCCLTSLQSIS